MLAVDVFLHKLDHHAVPREKLLEFLQRARAAIADVVVGVVAESKCDLPCRSHRHICRGVDGIAEQTVGFAHLVRRLPQIGAVVVLELADACKRLVVDEEGRILAVGTLETVDEGKKLVRLDVGYRCGEGSLPRGKKSLRLVHAVAIEESVPFGIAERLAELLDEIDFKVEGIVVEQLLRNLDRNVQLVRVEDNLVEGRVAEGELCAFLDSRCRQLRSRDVDLMLAARRDRRRQGTQDVLLAEDVDEALVVFLRHKTTAACVRAFLQHVPSPAHRRWKWS